jgi:type IV pilus assembly protein PilV
MNPRQSGFSLIEVLVTIAILMIGLLGLAALQTNATVAEMEAYQRSQALVLVQDMADRIAANKLNADAYLVNNVGGTVTSPCPTTPAAAVDLCEWSNKLAGAAEVTAGGTKVGAMIGARGCVTQPTPKVYLVTVTWQGMKPIGFGVAGTTCGGGLYGIGQRRLVSVLVRVGLLGTTT